MHSLAIKRCYPREYIAGYKDGKAAAPFWTGMITGIVNGSLAYVSGFSEPPIPEKILKQIQDKPLDYQKGFKEGYRYAIESDAHFFGLISEELDKIKL